MCSFNDARINTAAVYNINVCKSDWNSYETSWDFKRNPLV